MRCSLLLLLALCDFAAGQVYAIVSLQATNPLDVDAKFVIELDTDHAPRNVGAFMLLADPHVSYYSNRGPAFFADNTRTNPSGQYIPSLADGTVLPGGTQYNISSARASGFAQLNRTLTSSLMGTFILESAGLGSINWNPTNPHFTLFTVPFGPPYGTEPKYVLKVDTSIPYIDEFTGNLKTGPFYDGRTIVTKNDGYPTISLGEKATFATHTAPGWLLQNEMIDLFQNSFNNAAGPFGDRFSNAAGVVGVTQRFAVAMANEDLTSPNTTGAEILITGQLGNPNYRGRYTHIGSIVDGQYIGPTGTVISGSRLLVQDLINGTRDGIINSIKFEYINTGYNPVEYLGFDPSITSLPVLSEGEGTAEFDFSGTSPKLLTGAEAGQIRFIDASTNLTQWHLLGQSSYPDNASEESGFDLTNTFQGSPKGFFRISKSILSYPEWPANNFNYRNQFIKFKGRQLEAGAPAQVLNIFNIIFGDGSGQMQGIAGDLAGTHNVTNVEYQVLNAYTGLLTMDTTATTEPLKLKLYFDAHKQGEINNPSPVIDRFHRLQDNIVTITLPDGTTTNQVFEDAEIELGIWQIQ